jgi:8-oxo-dGTP pyrophosphatase MutT (NUDIX family)
MQDPINVAHYISITGIVRKGNKFLICQRSPQEHIFPLKWCVPGGKIEQKDFLSWNKDTKDHWLSIFEKILKKEILEECNIEIKNIGYVSSLALIRPNGYTGIIVSLYADYESGDVKLMLPDELVDHAWVTLEEAKDYDLIENIYEQLEKVEKIYHSKGEVNLSGKV